MIKNALTIDVEDYFQVSAFQGRVSRSDWETRECRVEKNIDLILGLFSERSTKGTFFTLGWIAQRYPSLVRRIVDEGHELASHGFDHERATDLSPDYFYSDVSKAKEVLEDVSGVLVSGYRAPSFSIGEKNQWAYDRLARAGYVYSSSIYPITHDHYGMPDAPRFAHRTTTGVIEIPITTLRVLNHNFPASGGGYFRLLPYPVSHWILSKVNSVDKSPVVFYFHPWELDPSQPRVQGISRRSRFRHYLNLSVMEKRLIFLLTDFRWGRMDDIFLRPERLHEIALKSPG